MQLHPEEREREMGRSSRRDTEQGANKGAWTALEDQILRDYVKEHGEGKWGKMSRETGALSLLKIQLAQF